MKTKRTNPASAMIHTSSTQVHNDKTYKIEKREDLDTNRIFWWVFVLEDVVFPIWMHIGEADLYDDAIGLIKAQS